MGLINNSLESLYNGVSEQSAEHRLQTQVKEMVNAYPTINTGLLKRNPTTPLTLSTPISYTPEIWTHEYDRGLAGINEEKFSINVTSDGMEIVNVLSGKVYKEGGDLTFEGLAKDYLHPFTGANGYSSVTIKDTTFLVNKAMTPTIKTSDVPVGNTLTVYESQIQMLGATTGTNVFGFPIYRTAPLAVSGATIADGFTTFTVDGITIKLNSIHPNNTWMIFGGFIGALPYSSYIADVIDALQAGLSSDLYEVYSTADNKIHIKRLDGSTIAVTHDIVFKTKGGTVIAGTPSDYLGAISYTNFTDTVNVLASTYLKTAYIWIKSANAVNAYTYSVTITDDVGNTVTASNSSTTTTAAATALAGTINANANFTATAVGSVIKVTSNVDMTSVESSDSWGNQATTSWHWKIPYATDLPQNMGFQDAYVNITGDGTVGFTTYWLKYSGSQWEETKSPADTTLMDSSTMPHVLVRNADDTFTLKEYDGWDEKLVGDTESNKRPSFLASDENPTPAIKDIFFFKNRLGFITERTVILSEVGSYGNFWRTTTSTLLDSDPIDTAVDSTQVIKLNFATYLEDSVLLFADKAQFRLAGGKILSPSSVQVAQVSSYEINRNVRPVFINDKVFFCTIRGNHTAVMQYQVKATNASSEAIDITAHVKNYIPSKVVKMSGSANNNMLFITPEDSREIYVYKYYDVGSERHQSAWFKWAFNGVVYNAFALGKNLNIMIKREEARVEDDWVVGSGIWDGSKLWDGSKTWIGSPSELVSNNQFETMQVAPEDYMTTRFVDNLGTDNETVIKTDVNFGEWVPSVGGKDIRGIVQFKTAMISSEVDSDFELVVNDLNRGDTRVVASKYTVNRRPMVYGNTKNIEVGVRNYSEEGFRINTVNYEGNYNSRSKRLK